MTDHRLKKQHKLLNHKLTKTAVATAAAFLVGPILAPVTAHAYTIDQTYALGANGGKHVRTANNYIVAHDVGTDSSAINNAQFEHRTWSSNQAYVTYIVGDGGHVYQIGTPGQVAWGAGSYANANSPVQVELAHTSNAVQFKTDYATYVALLRNSAKAYGLPVRLDQGRGIITHLYVTQHWWGDHQDPYGYLARWGISKTQFAHDIAYGVTTSGVNSTQQAVTGTTQTTTTQSSSRISVDGYWGPATTRKLQAMYGTPQDGIISGQYRNAVTNRMTGVHYGSQGSMVVRTMQRRLGVRVDGYLGPQTIRAMQRRLGTPQDGALSNPSMVIKAMQAKLNAGVRPF
ncbi:MAG: peptidoglycan-binding domain-containing protein [Lactobacillus sp.]|nr:MAG: peptidoglycan-binding domain-containing protein [Lactobacillus sp.]